MNQEFSQILSQLRHEKGLSQRAAAEALGISQALLSHYEKGIREPGLPFLIRVCDFYHVSADYLLGRTKEREGILIPAAHRPAEKKSRSRQAILEARKPILAAVCVLFDLLGKMDNPSVTQGAVRSLSAAIYQLFRQLAKADPGRRSDLFPTGEGELESGLAEAEQLLSRSQFSAALQSHVRQRRELPLLRRDALSADFGWAYPGLEQLLQDTGKRISALQSQEPGRGRRRSGEK